MYVAKDSKGDERLWVDIVPHANSCVKSLMANIKKRPEICMVKKVHRFTHGNEKELEALFREAGLLTPKIKNAIAKIESSCITCATSGRPVQTKKISLKHVNKEFNVEVQADFMTVNCKEKKYEVLNVEDTSTGYGERKTVDYRCAKKMMAQFEEIWSCRHGAPKFSVLTRNSACHFPPSTWQGMGVKVNERPARSSHKSRRVERSNGVFKSIFEKIRKEN